ncbi:hypothetical protein [Solidesulfovibrio sp.]|uniref:hypothetical protein n=1 Tax=Solidesulfovibrio sp. TaxID=2910990 RepID=UPI00261EE23F|nr:hypothetical protein [Solidesulfovibrio sp.]
MYDSFKLCCRVIAAFAVVFLVFASPAYSMTLPIHGAVLNSTETFTGKATVHFWGDGNLTLTTNKGVMCKGDFVHASQQKGSGTVTCEDGRLGTFEFVTAGFSGTGAGMIGPEHFNFRIGK